MYIINLRYAHLNPIFRLHNIHLVFSTCPHKYKLMLCTEKPVLKNRFQDFWYTNFNNHLIFSKMINMYLKAKNSLHTPRILCSMSCKFEQENLPVPGRRCSRNAAQHILEVVPGPSHASQQDSGEESDFGRR